jgi:hypothetical protein
MQKRYLEDVKKHREEDVSNKHFEHKPAVYKGSKAFKCIMTTSTLLSFSVIFLMVSQEYLSLAVPFFALVVVNRWRQPAVVELNLIIINNCGIFPYFFIGLCPFSMILRTATKISFMYPQKGIAWPQSQFPLSCVCE